MSVKIENDRDRAVEHCDTCLEVCERLGIEREVKVLTTLSVPMSTFGGDWSACTISEMKLAVIPIMVMRETACIPLTTVKVAPRAPKFCFAIAT